MSLDPPVRGPKNRCRGQVPRAPDAQAVAAEGGDVARAAAWPRSPAREASLTGHLGRTLVLPRSRQGRERHAARAARARLHPLPPADSSAASGDTGKAATSRNAGEAVARSGGRRRRRGPGTGEEARPKALSQSGSEPE